MFTVVPFVFMHEEQSVTFRCPRDIHEAFLRKCFLAKPRVTMTDLLVNFMADSTGLPRPKRIDRRKLTHDQREALDKKPKPRR